MEVPQAKVPPKLLFEIVHSTCTCLPKISTSFAWKSQTQETPTSPKPRPTTATSLTTEHNSHLVISHHSDRPVGVALFSIFTVPRLDTKTHYLVELQHLFPVRTVANLHAREGHDHDSLRFTFAKSIIIPTYPAANHPSNLGDTVKSASINKQRLSASCLTRTVS